MKLASFRRFARRAATALLVVAASSCSAKRGDHSNNRSGAPAKNETASNTPESDTPPDKKKVELEAPSEPVVITGTNLTYDGGRPRCTSQPVAGSADEYVVNCFAVEMVEGAEIPAKTLTAGLQLEWLAPTTKSSAGLEVQSCTAGAQNLAQRCQIKVAATSSTVDVDFGLRFVEPTRNRVETDVVTLPYSLKAIGNVAEVPLLAAATAEGAMAAERSWLFESTEAPLKDFPLADDSLVASCGDRFYATSRSRLFALRDGAAEHVAGSINAGNVDNLTHPLRTYWRTIDSMACRGTSLFLATRDPVRLYEVTKDLKISVFAKPSDAATFTEAAPKDAMRLEAPHAPVFDSKGNLYFLDGLYVRRVDTTGKAETVFDGSTALAYPFALALDEDANGAVKAYFVLDIGTGSSPTVLSIDATTGVVKTVAGNAGVPNPAVTRNSLKADQVALRLDARHLSLAKNSVGERTLLIAEGGDSGSANGEVLEINPKGVVHVLYKPGELALAAEKDPAVKGQASVGGGLTPVVAVGDSYYLKVRFATAAETTTNLVKFPVAGGGPTWWAGRVAPIADPVAKSAVDPQKLLLGSTVTAFSPTGALYVADNARRNLYRVLPDDTVERLALRFAADVRSMVVKHDTVNDKDQLIFVEAGEPGKIKSVTLGAADVSAVTTLVTAPGCKLPVPSPAPPNAAGLTCDPSAVTLDPQGRVVFFDHGYRFIRRLETNGTFKTLVGTASLTVSAASRKAGTTQVANAFGMSLVSSLAYDAKGNLVFVETGGYEQNGDGNDPVPFLPMVGSLRAPVAPTPETQSLIDTVVGDGDTDPTQLDPVASVDGAKLKLVVPEHLAVLPDGSLLVSDSGIILSIRPAAAGHYDVKRFFGGRQANVDCGIGTYDKTAPAGAVPTLTNALGRFCAGTFHGLGAISDCHGAGNAEGKLHIAIPQRLSEESSASVGGGTVLKLELACQAIKSL